MVSRKGTTLVELLVVFALIAVLIAILLPALRTVRTMAQSTVCATRLRDLTVAGEMYRQDYGRYPDPCRYASGSEEPGKGKILPDQVQRRLLNDVQPYLRFPAIEADTPASKLPPHVQSPAADKVHMGRGPRKSTIDEPEHYYTGFIYAARLDEASKPLDSVGDVPLAEIPADTPILLNPDRPATATGRRRAVIWADDLHYNPSDGGIWRFAHTRGGGDGAVPFAHSDARLLQGQHRAYTDGSVEWIQREHLSLEAPENISQNGGASYRMDMGYWWF